MGFSNLCSRDRRGVPIGVLLVCAITGVSLSGCVTPPKSPTSWQTGYETVQTEPPPANTNGAQRAAIVPSKCRRIKDRREKDFIPFGCINDRNLQRMVEQPGDLLQGRPMGPARAAPVAAAASYWLKNSQSIAEKRRARLERESRSEMRQFTPGSDGS